METPRDEQWTQGWAGAGRNILPGETFTVMNEALGESWEPVELLERLRAREEAAWKALYEEMFPQLYRYGLVRLGSPQAAEDMAEEVFLKALEGIDGFHWRGVPVQHWMRRIAHNVLVDRYSQAAPEDPLDEDEETEPLAGETEPVELLEKNERGELLLGEIQHLAPDYREVLFLRFYQDLSTHEVAEILGRSEGAVRVLQYRALGALEKQLGKDGWRAAEG